MKFKDAGFPWAAAVMISMAVIPAARGVWFDLPNSGTKCVSEELRNNVVVLAEYYAFFGEGYDANSTDIALFSIKVTSPYGKTLHHQEKVSHGQFSFTTTETGNYLACFTEDGNHHGGKKMVVGIDWKTGIATKDWESVAKKENIEGLQLQLTKLQSFVDAIRGNLNDLIQWEEEMRGVSEKTNARVARWSIMSLGICIAVSVFQVWFLQRYFQKKKLI